MTSPAFPTGWSGTQTAATDPTGQSWNFLNTDGGGWYSGYGFARQAPWTLDFDAITKNNPLSLYAGDTAGEGGGSTMPVGTPTPGIPTSLENAFQRWRPLGWSDDQITSRWQQLEADRKSGEMLDTFAPFALAGLPAFAMIAGAGAGLGALGAEGVAGAAGIPELGLIANPATAGAATAAGIPASMLSGGPGALSLASLASGGSNFVGDLPLGEIGSNFTPSGPMQTPSWMGDQTFWTPTSTGSGGPMDWIKSLFPGGTGGPGMPWSPLTSLLNIASGLIGSGKAGDLTAAGARATAAGDPFGPYRSGFANQLFELIADPSKIENVPGYKSGLRARQRALAAQGFNPVKGADGNMIVPGNWSYSMDRFGGDFYNQEVARLMDLSGAKIAPSFPQGILQGQMAGTALQGQSIQSLIAGLRGLLGG